MGQSNTDFICRRECRDHIRNPHRHVSLSFNTPNEPPYTTPTA